MKKQTSRRDFIARSSLLLAAMGVAPHSRIEWLQKFGKKIGAFEHPLQAAELANNSSQFCVELVFRSGYPLDSLFCPASDMDMRRVASCMPTGNTPEARLARRAAAHLPQGVIQLPGTLPGTNLYLTQFAADLAPLVNDGTLSIASSKAIRTNGGHEPNFATRNAAMNSGNAMVANGGPAPVVHFTHLMPQSTIIKGVEWKGNDGATFDNAPAPFSALTRVRGNTSQADVSGVMLSQQARNFIGLFSPAAIPFSTEEAGLIADAAEKLNLNYIQYRAMNQSQEIVSTARLGVDLLTQDYSAALRPSMDDYVTFDMGTAKGGVRLGEALYLAVKAFSLGLIRGISIQILTGDWHDHAQMIDHGSSSYDPMNTRYAEYATYISKALAEAYKLAKTLPNPHAPGKTVAEGMTTLMTSEFTRTWMNNNCNDHGDGGTNGIVIMGPSANNLTAGNFDPSSGATVSVDRISGRADLSAPLFGTDSAYATLNAALGIPAAEINRYTSGAVILSMLKS
jgi:hypothetical protein